MTREEQIKQKADELGQKYFPNANNIWARENIESQYVSCACIEMTKWVDENPKEGLVSLDKVYKYLKNNIHKFGSEQDKSWEQQIEIFIENFKKAMEE